VPNYSINMYKQILHTKKNITIKTMAKEKCVNNIL